MNAIDFAAAFQALTNHAPFPWQQSLYDRFGQGKIPASCNLPTGLGKTNVIAVWLIALVNQLPNVPRRLVYVVNRRTVVDQTTSEVENIRCNLQLLTDVPEHYRNLAISTLRGQFADNREWSADPSRPAVICGTVDMIGSRLLFSGYGVGFKGKPLHAGFLGQDALLVHDEAHLEPAFQDLLTAIEKEQNRSNDPYKLRVMELTATSRGGSDDFPNPEEREANETNQTVKDRIGAKKAICLHKNSDQKKLADNMAEFMLDPKNKFVDSKRPILIFLRKVEDVEKTVTKLKNAKQQVQQLTGTLRGKERDELIRDPIFRRFLPNAEPKDETVFLVCTSAGEVGVNISADHLFCDLSTFESMAQRFGRVNRFGIHKDTEIHVFRPTEFDDKDDYDVRLQKTLALLERLNGDGSPKALGQLDPEERKAAFAPTPTILPVSDILFDAWGLTTIRDKLPGRPPVEPYLHGINAWEPPETHVAWRKEVGIIADELLKRFQPEELEDMLEDYPLKPHELLRDNSSRVFDRLKKLTAQAETPVWLVSSDDSVSVTSLGELIESGKESLYYRTVLLPPTAGGLENGFLTGSSLKADDVADDWFNDQGERRRTRVWNDEPAPPTMRLIRTIDINTEDDAEDSGRRFWRWYEVANEGGKTSKKPVLWDIHVCDVIREAKAILAKLPLDPQLKDAIIFAARFHDHGKRRRQFQTVLGNFNYPAVVLAKSGKKGGRIIELYRHEFGSLLDLQRETEFNNLKPELQDLILHLIAVHHGYGRPHFPEDRAFDPEPKGTNAALVAAEVPRRFARLQRRFGRWGLAYLESLLRAADWAASANPTAFVEE